MIENITLLLTKINELKETYCKLDNILTIFKKQIFNEKLDKEEKKYLKDFFNSMDKSFVKANKEILTEFVQRVCKEAYNPIYIQKNLSKSKEKYNIKSDWIDNIKELDLQHLQKQHYYKTIEFTKSLILKKYEILYKRKKRNLFKDSKNIKLGKIDQNFINKVEKIYNDLLKNCKCEIVIRAFSYKNKNKDIKEEMPSLFYEPKLIDKENEIYHDFIAAKPSEFENMTTFDTLTKMRHYEVPNRLLDVTFDPLLALFFSIGRKKQDIKAEEIKQILNDINKDKDIKIKRIKNLLKKTDTDFDGSNTICVYVVKKENIKNYDSDTVTVLSILTKLKSKDKDILKKIVDNFKKLNKQHYYSFNDIKSITKELGKELNFEFLDKIKIYINNKNKNEERKEKYSLLEIYKILPNKIFNVLNNIEKYFSLKFNKDANIKYYPIKEYLEKNGSRKVTEILSVFKDSLALQAILELLPLTEDIKNDFDLYFNEEDIQYLYSKLKFKVNENSKIFTVNELFNFFVSTCVGELNWQLKQEIPCWYENVLDIDTFTHCYLVKPKMNNPRIISQSGAFFIYPFEDTNIQDSLLETDDKKIIFKISPKIKEELDSLNIKETKYMPDDLTVYAEEIREKYKNA